MLTEKFAGAEEGGWSRAGAVSGSPQDFRAQGAEQLWVLPAGLGTGNRSSGGHGWARKVSPVVDVDEWPGRRQPGCSGQGVLSTSA